MIDTESIVFTEEMPSSTSLIDQPTKGISNSIDLDSIRFEKEQTPGPGVFTRLAEAAFNPISLAVSAGVKDAQDIPLKMTPDERKAPDSQMISNMTGIPHEEIEKHYGEIKFLSDLAFKGPSQAGFEVGKRIDPVTTKAIVDKTMTPALVAAAVANPIGTAAGLVAFTALDHIIPTSKFIPENATESEAASIELIGMIAKGAIVGGLFHGAGKMIGKFTDPFIGMDKFEAQKLELLEKHTYEKLKERGLPDTITVTPEQLKNIQESGKFVEGEQPDIKLSVEALGIDQQTAETAIKNNLNVKIKAEKLVKLALDDVSSEKVSTLAEQIAIEGTGETKTRGLSQGVEAKAVEKKLTQGFGDLPEYQVVNMKAQAEKASQIAKSDYEMAKRIAMGEEKPPADVIPEAVFMAVENKAILEGDTATLRELATASKLTTEATTMGQRIRTLAERDPESATGAIKEVLKTREEAVQKRLGKKKSIAKEVERISKDIKKELSKVKATKETWADFIMGLQC